MLAKILGLNIKEFDDLKPGTLVVYMGQLAVISATPYKRQNGPYRVAIYFNSLSANSYAQFIRVNDTVNWIGPGLRFPNPIERLLA